VYQKCTDNEPCLPFYPTKWADVTAELESVYVKYHGTCAIRQPFFLLWWSWVWLSCRLAFTLRLILVLACSFVWSSPV